jgi:hypothetical protein
VVGARRSLSDHLVCGHRQHDAQRGPPDAGEVAAGVRAGPAVVLLGVLPRARCGHAPGRPVGDRYGHKKVFLFSLGLFGVGSTACAFSTSVAEFMAARVLLGLAGAGEIVMAISSLTVLFSRKERPKAVGILAAGNFLAMPIGPILGGWILTNYWWGLGVPDQRSSRLDRLGGRHRSIAGVSGSAATEPGFDRSKRLCPRAGCADLRTDQGGRGWLEQSRRPAHDLPRYHNPGRLPCLGAPIDPPS